MVREEPCPHLAMSWGDLPLLCLDVVLNVSACPPDTPWIAPALLASPSETFLTLFLPSPTSNQPPFPSFLTLVLDLEFRRSILFLL